MAVGSGSVADGRSQGGGACVTWYVLKQILHGSEVEGPQPLGLGHQLLGAAPAQHRRTIQQRARQRGHRQSVDQRDVLWT